jgi:cell pole-organizing protein PopZ
MEEILASIRRIIADEPAKISRHESSRNEASRNEGLRSENPSNESSHHESPTGEIAQSEDAPPARGSAAESWPVAEFAASDDLAHPGDAEKTATEAPEEPRPAAPVRAAGEPHRHMRDQGRNIVRDIDRESEREAGRDGPEHGLISAATTAAVDSAFNTLAQTVLVQNSRTLEDLVREILRPMLKIWLDDNLPSMVERLVRAEIERVSRRRG